MMKPALISEEIADCSLRWTFIVEATSPFFRGHFAGHPILPGVVLLAWMLGAAERLQGQPCGDATTLLNVKFQVVVLPDTLLHLELTPKPSGHYLAAVRSAAGVHATALIPPPERR